MAVVIAAFFVHCIVDGISYSFAVFYVDLLTHFSAYSHAKVVMVGTLLPATCLFVGQSSTRRDVVLYTKIRHLIYMIMFLVRWPQFL